MIERLTDDARFLTGRGRYLADLAGPDVLHAWFVRSPVAHGRIRSVDTDEATGLPGVRGVFTASDLDLPAIPSQTGRGPEAAGMERPVLAGDTVRHVGEPVAVVVADSARIAEDAAAQVWLDIEELPAVVDPAHAATSETLLFPQAGTNRVSHSGQGDPPTPGAVQVTVHTVSQRLALTSIEPLGILVRPIGEDLDVWCGHQAPHRLRAQLASLLGHDRIRVRVPDVGGAFGMKGMLFPEYPVITALAERLAAPVMWLQTRREHMQSGTHGRGQIHRVTLHGTEDGRITGAEVAILADVGAYPHNGSQIPTFSRLVAGGLYDIAEVRVEIEAVVTNLAPIGSYRGAGRPEAALAIERAVDAFARHLGRDPLEVRLHNLITDLPHKTVTGALYDSGDYREALATAMELIDVPAVRAEQRRRRQEGRDPIGLGVAAFIERAGGAVDSGEYARVEVDDRAIHVRVGSADSGQGHDRLWTSLAKSVLGVDVVVHTADTDEVDAGVGTFASRTTQIAGSAVLRMAEQVREEGRRRAADRFEAAIEDVVYQAGEYRVRGVPGPGISIHQLADSGELAASEMFVPGAQTFPYGVHVAEVEVVRETGEVRVRRIVAVDDCGTVLDPHMVEGQLVGSLAQGLGQALLEEVRYDDGGQPLSASLMDYLVPTAADMPPVVSDRLTHPAPSNPLGAKGAGEAGCIGLPPAILNAVIDALWDDGVRDLQLPLRPERVWAAIQAAGS
ncbi:MAG: xanthine dehydrogenase family protein molybdopterin-binding subunit [Acidimicrobiia bacterium]